MPTTTSIQGSNLPRSLEEVSVQLVFSDGGGDVGAENVWQFYTVALFPFLLGVPPTQVTLFLAKGYLSCTNEDLYGAASVCRRVLGMGNVDFFPTGYFDYLKQVHNSGAQELESLPLSSPCALRVITGHGFADFSGGHIRCGETIMYYKDIKANPTVLSVLDICSSAYAVAWLEGVYPDNPRKFNSKFRKNMFRDAKAPVACEVNSGRWAFRVGGFAESTATPHEDGFTSLSLPFGDAVASSILLAIKTYVEKGQEGNLDEIFVDIYENRLKTVYLPEGATLPKAHSMLEHLQTLILRGVLPVNLETFNCEFFRRCDFWYLTGERANTALVEGQQDLAVQLIELVTKNIVDEHERNAGTFQVLPASEKAWKTLVDLFGPFGRQLKAIALEMNEGDGKIEVSDDGVELEAWAVSSASLPQLLKQVQWSIATGSSTDPDLEDEV